ncbi:MAG: FkbM family methyltransferase [Gemmataceae bacterium]
MQRMVSYSINLEDVVLAKVFRDRPRGFYVDVGANDPTTHSNTRHFYDLGWSGINLEPGGLFPRLAEQRPRDRNFNVAVSDARGEMTYHEFPAAPGLSGLQDRVPDVPPGLLAGATARKVPVRLLRDVLEEAAPPAIDFMGIDVEGHERQVLLGNDWARWRPRVVFLEATVQGSGEPCHHLWEDVLVGAGYRFAYADGLNRFYVRAEDGGLIERFGPPCVFDHYITQRELLALDALEGLRREHSQVCAELNDLHRGVGRRTLAVGLRFARLLHATLGLFRPKAAA